MDQYIMSLLAHDPNNFVLKFFLWEYNLFWYFPIQFIFIHAGIFLGFLLIAAMNNAVNRYY